MPLKVFFKVSDPDAPLLARARRGDRAAFDALVARHNCLLKAFLARRLPEDVADDVAQEVWVTCWSKLGQFSGRARFKGWLFGIATHKATDALRTRYRLQSREAKLDSALELALPESVSAQLEQATLVESILASLPEPQREVVELYYFAELTLAEIATTLGRNLNTVKYQFYRAHTHARSCEEGDR